MPIRLPVGAVMGVWGELTSPLISSRSPQGHRGTGEFAPAENCSHPASWGCSSPGKFWLFAAVLPSAMTIPCLMLSGVACPGSLSFWGYDPMRSCHTPQVPLAAPSHAQPPATTELGRQDSVGLWWSWVGVHDGEGSPAQEVLRLWRGQQSPPDLECLGVVTGGHSWGDPSGTLPFHTLVWTPPPHPQPSPPQVLPLTLRVLTSWNPAGVG